MIHQRNFINTKQNYCNVGTNLNTGHIADLYIISINNEATPPYDFFLKCEIECNLTLHVIDNLGPWRFINTLVNTLGFPWIPYTLKLWNKQFPYRRSWWKIGRGIHCFSFHCFHSSSRCWTTSRQENDNFFLLDYLYRGNTTMLFDSRSSWRFPRIRSNDMIGKGFSEGRR